MMSSQFESSHPTTNTPTTHSSNTSRQTEQSWHIVRSLVANTINKWNDDPGPRFAAALAFYTAFTIVPLVVLVVMVSASMMGDDAIRGDLHNTSVISLGSRQPMDCFISSINGGPQALLY